jgi:hypothetical protein
MVPSGGVRNQGSLGAFLDIGAVRYRASVTPPDVPERTPPDQKVGPTPEPGATAATQPSDHLAAYAKLTVRIPSASAGFQDVARSLASFNQTFSAMTKALAPVVAGLQESFRRVAPAVVAALENARKNADDVFGRAEALGNLAWTLPMNATLPECRELVDAATDADALDAAFERFYFDGDGEQPRALYAGCSADTVPA